MWTKDGGFILDEREAFEPRYPFLEETKGKYKESESGKVMSNKESVKREPRDCLRWKISYPSKRRWLDRENPRDAGEWYACQTVLLFIGCKEYLRKKYHQSLDWWYFCTIFFGGVHDGP